MLLDNKAFCKDNCLIKEFNVLKTTKTTEPRNTASNASAQLTSNAKAKYTMTLIQDDRNIANELNEATDFADCSFMRFIKCPVFRFK